MKKLFAILLVLALLLPMGVVAHAEEAETKPFFLVNWSGTNDVDYSNVYAMAYFWSDAARIANNIPHVSWSGASEIPALAQELKERFDEYPEGARYINFCMPHDAVHTQADICFAEDAVPLVSNWLDEFLAEFKRIGGKLDGLTIDIEYLNIYQNYIYDNYFNDDPDVYSKIASYPVYEEVIRPQLVERGFKFYEPVTETTPELFALHPNSGSEYTVSRAIWNTVMRSYMGTVVTRCCEPVWDYYPDAVVSDYQSKNVDPWLKEVSDSGGTLGGGGTQYTAGNSSNENFYSVRPYTSFFTSANGPVYSTIPGYTNAVYENSEFNRFLYDTILGKDTYLASDNGDVSWWLAPYCYTTTSDVPYYAETIFHLGMLDPQIFLGYILQQDCKTDGQNDVEKYDNALEIVNDCLKELTKIVGYADRKPLNVDPNWNTQYVLSGMYAGGKNYWRLTPDTSKVSLEDFKVEGTDPTFSVGGETITFPQGKIIETGEVSVIGTCGYWIETPADVTPVATRAENYFREYPAYGENFDGFEVGTEYNYNNALPVTCWEIKKQAGGTGTVVADGDGKALAVTGTYTAKNVKMPENITAGDTYAENQAWEISFTLPADMAADAELVLLNAANEKKKSSDGGFKIAGGKVYYSQDTEYVEMEGVTLTAGTKYTVVREMDFSDAKNFTSDYYVYGADGSLLGSAKDIPIEELVLPVYSISLGCTKVAGEAVLLDDYKLYPTKVAADFYLYDADTGMKVTELDKAREGNTAYRLSWLNSAQTEKSYTVMAAYYDGETKVSEEVIKEVKMAPNADGVITGVVENKNEGKTMLVYLRDNNPAEPSEDDPTGGDKENPGNTGLDSTMIIIIAAAVAAVVVIAVVVIIVVASAKKKKNAAAAPAVEEAEVIETAPETDAASENDETPETDAE